jgi:DNA mismatch endonuclease (patch repair protein)
VSNAKRPSPSPAIGAAPLRYRLREGHLLQVDDATSLRMAGVRQKATRPEQLVGSALRALGQRYRLNNKDLDGSPDFANRRAGWVLFVHGCFWHRHGCRATTTPTRNREFWEAKFARNVARDLRTAEALRAGGYRVIVIWECETKRGEAELQERLRSAFQTA